MLISTTVNCEAHVPGTFPPSPGLTLATVISKKGRGRTIVFTKTTEYALRAAVCIAQSDRRKTSTEIAEQTHVPVRYMSKVLQTLTEAELIESQRGPSGGFWLSRPAEEISLLDVVQCIQPIERITHCPIDLPEHADELCPLHIALDELAAMAREKLAGIALSELTDTSIVPLGLTINRQPPDEV